MKFLKNVNIGHLHSKWKSTSTFHQVYACASECLCAVYNAYTLCVFTKENDTNGERFRWSEGRVFSKRESISILLML